MDLNACIEREKPRLGDGWELRSVLHDEKNESRSLAVAVRKINGLRLQVRQNGLDGCAELSGLRRRISSLDRDIDLQQKSHGSPRNGLVYWIHEDLDMNGHLARGCLSLGPVGAIRLQTKLR